LFLALAAAQLSFVSGLPWGLRELNLLIIFMVLFLEIDSGPNTVWWFVAVGLVFGLYRSFFFPFFLIFWPLVFIFCRFLYSNLLTNRSLYSFLGLTVFTVWFYYFFYHSAIYIAYLFLEDSSRLFLLSKDFWFSLFWGTVVNSLAIILAFQLMNQATDRLKPVFIFRKK
jgi:hypothetical protein